MLSVGTIVRDKDTRIKMTVADSEKNGKVKCHYFDGGNELHTETFEVDNLITIPENGERGTKNDVLP